MPFDEDVTFEGYIYNNLRDYFDAHPEVQKTSPKGYHTVGHAIGLSHYLPYVDEDYIKLHPKYKSTLAHEIAHSLNYYNLRNHGINMITRDNYTEHDEVYAFGWEVGKEMFYLLKERESGYDGRLSTAVQSGDISKVTDLLNSDTNINAKDNVGQTPLHKATDESIATLLIERGAEINVRDNNGKTPFEIALEHHNIEVANFLANAKGKCDKTMLHYAAEDDNLRLIRFLIDNGADINAKDNGDKTPFEIALEDKKTQVANFLVNAKDKYGKTMLHYAVEDDNLKLVKLLIGNGADINIKDNRDKTLFEVALEGLIPLEGPNTGSVKQTIRVKLRDCK